MYQKFHDIAIQDSQNGGRYGIECLYRFYSYGLEKKFRADICQEFQDVLWQDYKESGLVYGMEKFWAFMHYYKGDEKVVVKKELQELFETKFTSMDDFRVMRPVVDYRR
jgi:la-related protein 1